jgi:hypothetical protein
MPVDSKLFTSDPNVRDRLNKALESDPDHIVPGSSGDHVAKIQVALSRLGKVQINQDEIDQKFYGATTSKAVEAFKSGCKPPLLNFKNQIDSIVGKKTTRELDRQMKDFENHNPPPPPPVPPAGVADVQVGPLGPRANLVTSYYQNCGLETIGPARVTTAGLRTYTTFEGLIDLLLTRAGLQQVIVNHGNPNEGLLAPWCRETTSRDTAGNIEFFSKVADALERGTANKNNPDFQDSVDTLKFILGISEQVVLRIAGKLVNVRKKPQILHFRACNLTQQVALGYKRGFGARMVTFHPVRLLFLHVKPVRFAPGHSPADFPFKNNTARDRARVFVDPFGELTTMVIAVRDLDGHSNVFDFSFVERLVQADIQEWAKTLIGTWRGVQGEFVVPVMWDNHELSYHCPNEDGWREKLRFV